MVGERRQKLIEQVTVGGMDFNRVKACLVGSRSSSRESVDHTADAVSVEGSGDLIVACWSAGVIGSDFEQTMVAQTPLGRIGQPDDIASVAVFLASDDARWLTGERLAASGGFR